MPVDERQQNAAPLVPFLLSPHASCVLAAASCALALMRFPAGGNNSAEEAEQEKGSRRNNCLVSPHELRSAIADRVLACQDGPRFQVPPDVFRELFD